MCTNFIGEQLKLIGARTDMLADFFITISGAVPLSGIDVVDGSGRIVSNRFLCTGTETRLFDCSRRRLTYATGPCYHSVDIGIRCLPHFSGINN